MTAELFVEDEDIRHVVYALCEHHRVPEVFTVESPKTAKGTTGVDELLEQFPVRLKDGTYERFGLVLDANTSLDARWQSIRDRLAKRYPDHTLPAAPDRAGTVVDLTKKLRFGVWLMPDNTIPGILEDFVRFLVPDDDVLMPAVETFLDGLPETRFSELAYPKARIHTWLGIQKEPGKPLGQAVIARYLHADAAVVAPFIEWLERLFVAE